MAITEKKLDDWARKHDLKRLHKALSEPSYQVRLKAIAHLARIKNSESLPHLERLIDDAFISVLKEASDAIRSIAPSHSSLSVFETKIREKEELEAKRKARTEANFEPIPEIDEREKLERMAKEYDVNKIYQVGLKEERKRITSLKVAVLILTVVGGLTIIISILYRMGAL